MKIPDKTCEIIASAANGPRINTLDYVWYAYGMKYVILPFLIHVMDTVGQYTWHLYRKPRAEPGSFVIQLLSRWFQAIEKIKNSIYFEAKGSIFVVGEIPAEVWQIIAIHLGEG